MKSENHGQDAKRIAEKQWIRSNQPLSHREGEKDRGQRSLLSHVRVLNDFPLRILASSTSEWTLQGVCAGTVRPLAFKLAEHVLPFRNGQTTPFHFDGE